MTIVNFEINEKFDAIIYGMYIIYIYIQIAA